MLVVKKKDAEIITLEEVLERLKRKNGILLWRHDFGDLVVLKSSGHGKSFGWVDLYFNRGMDNDIDLSGSSLEDFLGTKLGTIYYFEDRVEALEFMLDFYKRKKRKNRV